MEKNIKDWRLQGQDKYLFEKELVLKQYADRTTSTDHDHCEFCNDKFSDLAPNCLKVGFTTNDDYYWICEKCCRDFEVQFKWTIL